MIKTKKHYKDKNKKNTKLHEPNLYFNFFFNKQHNYTTLMVDALVVYKKYHQPLKKLFTKHYLLI